MKQLIVELPTLTAPMEKEELIVYLAAAQEAVSAVLMTEIETKQMPVYFVSCALQGPEINYTSMEKLVLTLVHAIKGQILADLIVERPEEDSSDTPMEGDEELPDPWTLFTYRFDATNNEAEYEALIAGLRIAEQMGVKNLQVSVASRLVATQVPKSENKKADALSKIASTSFAHLTKQVLVDELSEKSINVAEVLTVVEEEGDTWMTPIYNYLTE
ncbi:reverse transcriptase domain-containing protein [Tanacetum coccineum]